jgi:hypothetical protein
MRTWAKRATLGLTLAAVAGGGYVGLNWSHLRAASAVKELRSAPVADDRTKAASTLLALGDAGTGPLVAALKDGDEPTTTAVAAAVAGRLTLTPPSDPAFAQLARLVLTAVPDCGPAGQTAALELVDDFLKCDDPAIRDGCRDLVRRGLTASAAETRVKAIKLASKPGVGEMPAVAALMDAKVRTAALLTLGPAEVGVVPDEDLFPVLNDDDAGVRELARSVLTARGRSATDIQFGRKLTHPSAAERLSLLVELREADEETVKDVGPWLERLSRDPHPAVRAGAARVAMECRLPFVEWVRQLATADPDATVRRVAGFYATGGVRQTGN